MDTIHAVIEVLIKKIWLEESPPKVTSNSEIFIYHDRAISVDNRKKNIVILLFIAYLEIMW